MDLSNKNWLQYENGGRSRVCLAQNEGDGNQNLGLTTLFDAIFLEIYAHAFFFN